MSTGSTHAKPQRYELITQNMDWNSASAHCRSMHASLLVIDDHRHQLAINSYLSRISRTSICLSVCLSVRLYYENATHQLRNAIKTQNKLESARKYNYTETHGITVGLRKRIIPASIMFNISDRKIGENETAIAEGDCRHLQTHEGKR